MRRVVSVLVAVFAFWSLCGQNTYAYHKSEVMIPMRDGVKLYTAVYMPNDDSCSHPILMMRTPYGCRPYGSDRWSSVLNRYDMRDHLRKGYIIVLQDVRGRYMSEGYFEHIRPYNPHKTGTEVDESSDAYDTADWLIKHVAHNNGKIGVVGNSYPGFYAYMAALGGHPAIKAVSPQAPVTDWFMGDDVHHNGVLAEADAFSFLTGFEGPRSIPSPIKPQSVDYRNGMPIYDFLLGVKSVDSLTRLIDNDYPIAFWNEMMQHPLYDDWWKQRAAMTNCNHISAAMLVVGGLFDAEDGYGVWNMYRGVRRKSPQTICHLVVGPWIHGGQASQGRVLGMYDFGDAGTSKYYFDNYEIPFFDAYLLDGKDSLPNVSLFYTGENVWRTFRSLPVAKKYRLYFNDGGTMSNKIKGAKGSYAEYMTKPQSPVPTVESCNYDKRYMYSDQTFASRRSDVVTFETAPLTAPVTVSGPVRVVLSVATDAKDADFVVKVIDVYPRKCNDANLAGCQMLVRGDIMRGSFRKGFGKQVYFEQNKADTVGMRLVDVAHTFGVGHRIMVQVQSSWFPLFEINPEMQNKSCRVRIYHARDHKSYIEFGRLLN